MYVCPSAPNDPDPGFAPVDTPGAGRTSYVFNGCGSDKPMTSVAQAGDYITFQGRATTAREAVCLPRLSMFHSDGSTKANDSDDQWIGFTHDLGDNYAFSDGHAKFKFRHAVRFKELGFWEWVNTQNGWQDPATNPVMDADPTQGKDYWGDWGNCDPEPGARLVRLVLGLVSGALVLATAGCNSLNDNPIDATKMSQIRHQESADRAISNRR